MKMLFIAYNEAIDEEVMEILDANAVASYTKWAKVLGKGKASGPHLQSQVWPKANNVLMIAAADEQAGKIVQDIRGLRTTLSHEGVKAFVLPLEEAT
jgi:nitrogen regulatory protein PII